MVDVVGHLGPQSPRRRHHLHHLLLVFLFLPPPPFIAFTLLPIASEGHPCVPLCRVTFGLRTQPNLPGGRPGPPFSTNPGNELRGSRGLLVAMATKPSPNPLNQTPISYPSELCYPLPPPLPRRARRLRCRSRRQRESLSISSFASLRQLYDPRLFLIILVLSPYFAFLSIIFASPSLFVFFIG